MLSELIEYTIPSNSIAPIHKRIAVAVPRCDRDWYVLSQLSMVSVIDVFVEDLHSISLDEMKRKLDGFGRRVNPEDVIVHHIELSDEAARDRAVLQVMRAQYLASTEFVVDISGMSRLLMASVVACIYELANEHADAMLTFMYTLAKFTMPPESILNKRISAVHSKFCGITRDNSIDKVAIVGLGYERDKAIGAIEYLEIDPRFVWRPNSSEHEYARLVNEHNKSLLELQFSSQESPLITNYSVMSPHSTLLALLAQVRDIANDHQPVLLPFGPKMFSFLSLLVGAEVQEATVWDVVSDETTVNTDPLPAEAVALSFKVIPAQRYQVV
jgi:hypothetical protein